MKLNLNHKERLKLSFLVFLMFVDYYLTYKGIHIYSVVEEGNIFMKNFMELPWYQGIIVRTLWVMSFIILFCITHVLHFEQLKDRYWKKRGIDSSNMVLNIAIVLNIYVMKQHFNWITMIY